MKNIIVEAKQVGPSAPSDFHTNAYQKEAEVSVLVNGHARTFRACFIATHPDTLTEAYILAQFFSQPPQGWVELALAHNH